MSHRILFLSVALFLGAPLYVWGQFPNANANKAPGNNYRHAPNTIVRTADDTLVVKVKGSGSRPVILIADYMQDESMYDEIVARHEPKAQFHIAIPAGMGGTPAYSWPDKPAEFDRIFIDFISQTNSKAGLISSTDRFEFYSNFWINMHHMWFRKATQSQDTVWHASFDESFITQLNEEVKATLQKTIDYYREYLVGNSLLFNRALYRIKRLLIQFEQDMAVTAEDWPEARDFIVLLNDSKEIYQKYFWEDHNRQNNQILSDHLELIRKFENPALERISALAQQPWPEEKIRVDISYYANWAGAYTSTRPETHVVIASRAEKMKNDWLELLFHEPSHAIISDDEYMVGETIQKVSEELKLDPPRQLWHSLLFYFSGIAVQDLMKAEGVEYELYMIRNDVFDRHHEVILKYMPEYVNRNSELDEALKKLITAYNE